jgi:hypothetical protein
MAGSITTLLPMPYLSDKKKKREKGNLALQLFLFCTLEMQLAH